MSSRCCGRWRAPLEARTGGPVEVAIACHAPPGALPGFGSEVLVVVVVAYALLCGAAG